jgi:hypothetical protein
MRRVTVVVVAPRQRASEHHAERGAIPQPTRQAIADLEEQIAEMSARLRDLMP